MSDTTLRDCIVCGEKGDCIEGICSNCAAVVVELPCPSPEGCKHFKAETTLIWQNCAYYGKCKLQDSHKDLLEACESAILFIRNGVAMGYIKMPNVKTDPACKTLPKLEAAIAKAQPSKVEGKIE